MSTTHSKWPFESPTECGFYIFIIDDLLKRLGPLFSCSERKGRQRKRASSRKGELCVLLVLSLIALGFKLRAYVCVSEFVCECECDSWND